MRLSVAKLCLITVLSAFTGLQAEGGSASATGRAGVTILAPNRIERGSDFEFGTLASRTPSRIQVDTRGRSSIDGGMTLAPGTQTAAATVQIKGVTDALAVTVPDRVTLRGPEGRTLTATGFRADVTTSLRRETQTVRLGAALEVPAATTQGRYQGTLDVTLAFN